LSSGSDYTGGHEPIQCASLKAHNVECLHVWGRGVVNRCHHFQKFVYVCTCVASAVNIMSLFYTKSSVDEHTANWFPLV